LKGNIRVRFRGKEKKGKEVKKKAEYKKAFYSNALVPQIRGGNRASRRERKLGALRWASFFWCYKAAEVERRKGSRLRKRTFIAGG